jgi:SAM-dependent methyltransferase
VTATQEIKSRSFARLYNAQGAEFTSLAMPAIREYFETTDVAADNRNMLDVCCGTGQLVKYFLDNGYTATGVDLSEPMLEYARENAGEYINAGRARFVCADATDFSVGDGFGLATSTYNSLNQLQDLSWLAGCFRSVHAALVSGGVFVFDLLTQAGFWQDYNAMLVYDTDEMMYVHRGVYHGGDKAHARQSGFAKLADGTWERFEKFDTPTLYPATVVHDALQEAGFVRSWNAVYDELAKPSENPDAATRMVFVAVKG